MSNLKQVDRTIYLLSGRSADVDGSVYKALVEYRARSNLALGAQEQAAADAWLLDALRENRGILARLWDEMP